MHRTLVGLAGLAAHTTHLTPPPPFVTRPVEEHTGFTDNTIPARLVNLPLGQRKDRDAVDMIVKVGWPNKFLKAGITIVDSPGTSENEVLDSVVESFSNGVADVAVLYVIDGTKFVTEKVRNGPTHTLSLRGLTHGNPTRTSKCCAT